jgi:hypothetical protein
MFTFNTKKYKILISFTHMSVTKLETGHPISFYDTSTGEYKQDKNNPFTIKTIVYTGKPSLKLFFKYLFA